MKRNYRIKNTFFLLIVMSLTTLSCVQKKESSTQNTQGTTDIKIIEPVVISPQTERDTLKGSLKAIATGKIGNTFVTIQYHAPAVRGRVLWGGLVPFDQVWVTGAHMATSIEFEGSVKINNQEIPAGKYAFFTIPSSNEWIIILNKNWEQHLVDEYDQKDDVIRVSIKPETTDTNQERLMYAFENGGLTMSWEKLKIVLPIQE